MKTNRTNNRQRVFAKQRTGATAVEFALVVPVVLLVIFSLLEVTRAVTITDTARTAVIAGFREANVARTNADNVEAEMDAIFDLFGVRERTISVTPQEIDGSVNQVTIAVQTPLTSANGLFLSLIHI